MTATFQREGCKPVLRPSEKKLKLELSRVRMSFANITDDAGLYMHVAGGPGLFLLERHEADGSHFRAWQEKAVAIHPDGTLLAFSGGQVSMAQKDWFLQKQVTDIFLAFSEGRESPKYVQWKKVSLGQ